MPPDLNDPAIRLSIHEAVCAERYASILARMSRLEKITITVAGTLIVGMAAVIVKVAGLG